jgi:hypothetical protein
MSGARADATVPLGASGIRAASLDLGAMSWANRSPAPAGGRNGHGQLMSVRRRASPAAAAVACEPGFY